MAEDQGDEARVLQQVEAEMRRWRSAHPEATLTEIEQVLDQRLRAVRGVLLTELAEDTPLAEHCPRCGGRMVRRGQRGRTLTTQGGEVLPLERPYLTCPACGDGLFPPG